MAESNSYTGTVTSLRSTYQYLTTADSFSKYVQWACFTKNPFMKALGVEAFGVEAVQDLQAFGKATPTGRVITYGGGYAFSGSIFASTPTPYHVGRLGNFNPELVEGGDEYKYSWHRLVTNEFIPDVDVQDNESGRLIDIKVQKMEGMKQKYVESINYAILGNSSAPDYGSMGPDAVYNSLPYLISVTQDKTTGAIATTNSYWQNQYKALTSIGGGGEMDRPLLLRRAERPY